MSFDAVPFQVGDIVDVKRRTWSGINKLGGIARITKIHEGFLFDVQYIVENGRERKVEREYITLVPGGRSDDSISLELKIPVASYYFQNADSFDIRSHFGLENKRTTLGRCRRKDCFSFIRDCKHVQPSEELLDRLNLLAIERVEAQAPNKVPIKKSSRKNPINVDSLQMLGETPTVKCKRKGKPVQHRSNHLINASTLFNDMHHFATESNSGIPNDVHPHMVRQHNRVIDDESDSGPLVSFVGEQEAAIVQDEFACLNVIINYTKNATEDSIGDRFIVEEKNAFNLPSDLVSRYSFVNSWSMENVITKFQEINSKLGGFVEVKSCFFKSQCIQFGDRLTNMRGALRSEISKFANDLTEFRSRFDRFRNLIEANLITLFDVLYRKYKHIMSTMEEISKKIWRKKISLINIQHDMLRYTWRTNDVTVVKALDALSGRFKRMFSVEVANAASFAEDSSESYEESFSNEDVAMDFVDNNYLNHPSTSNPSYMNIYAPSILADANKDEYRQLVTVTRRNFRYNNVIDGSDDEELSTLRKNKKSSRGMVKLVVKHCKSLFLGYANSKVSKKTSRLPTISTTKMSVGEDKPGKIPSRKNNTGKRMNHDVLKDNDIFESGEGSSEEEAIPRAKPLNIMAKTVRPANKNSYKVLEKYCFGNQDYDSGEDDVVNTNLAKRKSPGNAKVDSVESTKKRSSVSWGNVLGKLRMTSKLLNSGSQERGNAHESVISESEAQVEDFSVSIDSFTEPGGDSTSIFATYDFNARNLVFSSKDAAYYDCFIKNFWVACEGGDCDYFVTEQVFKLTTHTLTRCSESVLSNMDKCANILLAEFSDVFCILNSWMVFLRGKKSNSWKSYVTGYRKISILLSDVQQLWDVSLKSDNERNELFLDELFSKDFVGILCNPNEMLSESPELSKYKFNFLLLKITSLMLYCLSEGILLDKNNSIVDDAIFHSTYSTFERFCNLLVSAHKCSTAYKCIVDILLETFSSWSTSCYSKVSIIEFDPAFPNVLDFSLGAVLREIWTIWSLYKYIFCTPMFSAKISAIIDLSTCFLTTSSVCAAKFKKINFNGFECLFERSNLDGSWAALSFYLRGVCLLKPTYSVNPLLLSASKLQNTSNDIFAEVNTRLKNARKRKYIGLWSLLFSQARVVGLNPVVEHALCVANNINGNWKLIESLLYTQLSECFDSYRCSYKRLARPSAILTDQRRTELHEILLSCFLEEFVEILVTWNLSVLRLMDSLGSFSWEYSDNEMFEMLFNVLSFVLKLVHESAYCIFVFDPNDIGEGLSLQELCFSGVYRTLEKSCSINFNMDGSIRYPERVQGSSSHFLKWTAKLWKLGGYYSSLSTKKCLKLFNEHADSSESVNHILYPSHFEIGNNDVSVKPTKDFSIGVIGLVLEALFLSIFRSLVGGSDSSSIKYKRIVQNLRSDSSGILGLVENLNKLLSDYSGDVNAKIQNYVGGKPEKGKFLSMKSKCMKKYLVFYLNFVVKVTNHAEYELCKWDLFHVSAVRANFDSNEFSNLFPKKSEGIGNGKNHKVCLKIEKLLKDDKIINLMVCCESAVLIANNGSNVTTAWNCMINDAMQLKEQFIVFTRLLYISEILLNSSCMYVIAQVAQNFESSYVGDPLIQWLESTLLMLVQPEKYCGLLTEAGIGVQNAVHVSFLFYLHWTTDLMRTFVTHLSGKCGNSIFVLNLFVSFSEYFTLSSNFSVLCNHFRYSDAKYELRNSNPEVLGKCHIVLYRLFSELIYHGAEVQRSVVVSNFVGEMLGMESDLGEAVLLEMNTKAQYVGSYFPSLCDFLCLHVDQLKGNMLIISLNNINLTNLSIARSSDIWFGSACLIVEVLSRLYSSLSISKIKDDKHKRRGLNLISSTLTILDNFIVSCDGSAITRGNDIAVMLLRTLFWTPILMLSVKIDGSLLSVSSLNIWTLSEITSKSVESDYGSSDMLCVFIAAWYARLWEDCITVIGWGFADSKYKIVVPAISSVFADVRFELFLELVLKIGNVISLIHSSSPISTSIANMIINTNISKASSMLEFKSLYISMNIGLSFIEFCRKKLSSKVSLHMFANLLPDIIQNLCVLCVNCPGENQNSGLILIQKSGLKTFISSLYKRFERILRFYNSIVSRVEPIIKLWILNGVSWIKIMISKSIISSLTSDMNLEFFGASFNDSNKSMYWLVLSSIDSLSSKIDSLSNIYYSKNMLAKNLLTDEIKVFMQGLPYYFRGLSLVPYVSAFSNISSWFRLLISTIQLNSSSFWNAVMYSLIIAITGDICELESDHRCFTSKDMMDADWNVFWRDRVKVFRECLLSSDVIWVKLSDLYYKQQNVSQYSDAITEIRIQLTLRCFTLISRVFKRCSLVSGQYLPQDTLNKDLISSTVLVMTNLLLRLLRCLIEWEENMQINGVLKIPALSIDPNETYKTLWEKIIVSFEENITSSKFILFSFLDQYFEVFNSIKFVSNLHSDDLKLCNIFNCLKFLTAYIFRVTELEFSVVTLASSVQMLCKALCEYTNCSKANAAENFCSCAVCKCSKLQLDLDIQLAYLERLQGVKTLITDNEIIEKLSTLKFQ